LCYAIYFYAVSLFILCGPADPPLWTAAAYAHPTTRLLSYTIFNAPSCTQKPPCIHLKTCTGSLASYSRFTLLSVSIKRKFCTSSADGAPGHGNHDMGPHGLNERDGAVDGLGPAVILSVALPDYERSQTYPDTLQLCSRLALRSSRSGNCQR
jgi:hypothetical protein